MLKAYKHETHLKTKFHNPDSDRKVGGGVRRPHVDYVFDRQGV